VHIAKNFGINLIVMGTYGRRGAERILIGSVAERVIEYSSCPVLVVK
jgi:nucleotide-binding universal stress UspA family protein